MTIGLLIFDDVEVLDFAGPLEVFSTINEFKKDAVEVFTITHTESLVKARANLLIQVNYTIENHPKLDMIIFPGGMGSRQVIKDERLMNWVGSVCQPDLWKLSVCTGSFILAKAGLLANKEACTHHTVRHVLKEIDPSITINNKDRFVIHEESKTATSGGISAGIDMSLYFVEKLFGSEIANQVAGEMEYPLTR